METNSPNNIGLVKKNNENDIWSGDFNEITEEELRSRAAVLFDGFVQQLWSRLPRKELFLKTRGGTVDGFIFNRSFLKKNLKKKYYVGDSDNTKALSWRKRFLRFFPSELFPEDSEKKTFKNQQLEKVKYLADYRRFLSILPNDDARRSFSNMLWEKFNEMDCCPVSETNSIWKTGPGSKRANKRANKKPGTRVYLAKNHERLRRLRMLNDVNQSSSDESEDESDE